jgi:hypothetical protein
LPNDERFKNLNLAVHALLATKPQYQVRWLHNDERFKNLNLAVHALLATVSRRGERPRAMWKTTLPPRFWMQDSGCWMTPAQPALRFEFSVLSFGSSGKT